MNLKTVNTVGIVSLDTAISPNQRKFFKRVMDDAVKAERRRLNAQITSARNLHKRLRGTPDDLLQAAKERVSKEAPHLTGARRGMAIGETLRNPTFQNEFKSLMR